MALKLKSSSPTFHLELIFLAYTLGLVATFVSLFLMNSAQPALLYLVPFTLIPVFIVSFLRGDLAAMWQGDYEVIKIDHFGCKFPW